MNNRRSYQSQVRQLRKVANAALEKYSFEVLKLKFVSHGENTIYKVFTEEKNFILRIHRANYHSKNAILEELAWVKQLSESTGLVPKPTSSINGLLVEEISIDHSEATRLCSVLSWIDGKMRFGSLTKERLFNAGKLAGQLHKSAENQKVKHRIYWDAPGLLGANATVGSLQNLEVEIGETKFQTLDSCRLLALRKMNEYNERNPDKSSLIHADLHFGNIIWQKSEPIPIDFDDCGFGFQMYDLAILLGGTDFFFKITKKKGKQAFIESLFEGYSSVNKLTKADLEILPYFKLTRNLVQVAWAYERRDHPEIYEHLKKDLGNRINYYQKALREGPDSLY